MPKTGGNTTQQVTSNEPHAAAGKIYDYVSPKALNIAKNSNPFDPSRSSTVVQPDVYTRQAQNSVVANARNNINGRGIAGAGEDLVASGGFNAPQQQSMEYFSGAGTNPFDLSGNAAYQDYRSKLGQDVANLTGQSLAGAGRYGSAAATDRMASAVGDALTKADLAQMGRLDSLNSQRFNAGQTGIGNLATGYDLQQLATQDLYDVGAQREDLAARKLNDKLRIEEGQKMSKLKELEWLNAIAGGAGSFGTSTTTAQQPGQNPFATALGYGSMGLGLLGGF